MSHIFSQIGNGSIIMPPSVWPVAEDDHQPRDHAAELVEQFAGRPCVCKSKNPSVTIGNRILIPKAALERLLSEAGSSSSEGIA